MSLVYKIVKGQIELVTGLHIGIGNDEIHIGGIDSYVIKNNDGLPYIPGSSLKGKIRYLLEYAEGLVDFTDKDGKPSDSEKYPDSLIPKMFGDTKGEKSRLLFRDCSLSKESCELLKNKDLLSTEAKSENRINRATGEADPRCIERVIPGLKFDYEIVIRLFDGDDETAIKKELVKGMRMLENDALGGSGSRGYGKIKFDKAKWMENLEL